MNSNDDFEEQAEKMSLSASFETSGGDLDAYMFISPDYTITCYNGNNQIIHSNGTYSISDYDESGYSHNNDYQGFLNTSEGAILWPYAINANNYEPTKFEIILLNYYELMLCYPIDGDFDDSKQSSLNTGWDEATFWYFSYNSKIKTPEQNLQTKDGWTWASDVFYNNDVVSASCWGNCGYGGGDSDAYTPGGKGFWWGCTTDDFADQFGDPESKQAYLSADEIHKEGEGAWMTFEKDGTLNKYSPNGNLVGTGTYNIDWTKTTDAGGFGTKTYGYMTTTGDGILLPYQINQEGKTANWFDIAYLDENYLILINQAEDQGNNASSYRWTFPANWGEATWWRFQRIK